MSDTDANCPPRRRASTIVVIAVVCVAVAGVMAMRFLSPPDAAAGNPTIDGQIDEILKRVGQNPTGPELPIEVPPGGPVAPEGGPPRNPFVGEGGGTKPPPADPRQARRLEIEQAAGQLRLQAVITGRHPVATINGRPVGLNSKLTVLPGEARPPVEFHVTSILPDAVRLEARDSDLDLTVETTLRLNRP